MHTEKYTLFLAWFAFLSAKPFMMQGETKERWMELCEQAAVVPDTIKLLTLILEINHLLEEKTQYTSLRRALRASVSSAPTSIGGHSWRTTSPRDVRDLLDTLADTREDGLCAKCGAAMKYVWGIFFYYDGDSWEIALPFCNCRLVRNQ
jgi:hypothetical protein